MFDGSKPNLQSRNDDTSSTGVAARMKCGNECNMSSSTPCPWGWGVLSEWCTCRIVRVVLFGGPRRMYNNCTEANALFCPGLELVPVGLFLPETRRNAHPVEQTEEAGTSLPPGLKVLSMQMPCLPHPQPGQLLSESVHCPHLFFPADSGAGIMGSLLMRWRAEMRGLAA